jgi:SHC-transforming protein 1
MSRECINRVCEAAQLKSKKKRKIDKNILSYISDQPEMTNAGVNVTLTISSNLLKLVNSETNVPIGEYDMPKISFASGGDADTLDFVAFVAKNEEEWRACYVLECGGGYASDIISTIGQAFELRYNQHLSSNTE